jgi:hypothetical protein
MTIQELFYAIAEENGITVLPLELEGGLPAHHCIRLQGEHAIYEGHAICLEEEQLFVFYVLAGVTVPPEKREKLALWMLERNYELKAGAWLIDPESGVLTVRCTQYMMGADWEKKQRIEELVTVCGRLCDTDYPQIVKEIFEG